MPKRKNLKTYLNHYCRYLSDCDNGRLTSFFNELKNNPRLEGPLFLYTTMFYSNEHYVKSYLDNEYLKLFEDTLKVVKKTKDLHKLLDELPYEESKALKSYIDYCVQESANSSLKQTYQKRLTQRIKDSDISNYRVCKDNKINPGNFHSFMAGSLDRLSLENCRKISQYLDSIEQKQVT